MLGTCRVHSGRLLSVVLAAAAALLVMSHGARSARADTRQIGQPAKHTLVILNDGSPPRLHEVGIEYTAYFTSDVIQSGSASKPLSGHFVDNRVCEAKIDGRIGARRDRELR